VGVSKVVDGRGVGTNRYRSSFFDGDIGLFVEDVFVGGTDDAFALEG